MSLQAPVSPNSDGENYPESPQVQIQPASPSGPGSSDKENRGVSGAHLSPSDKRRKSTQVMASQAQSTRNKKRRVSERGLSDQGSQAVHRRRLRQINDTDYYDPDQDEEERRRVRKGLRDLTRELNDSRAEYLQSESTGILETVQRADHLYESVKQTSDATLDSRLLVTAADLSYRKAAQLALGDGSAALDVDEFISKCISFMRRGPGGENDAPTSTQRRRNRASGLRDDNDAEAGGDEGDALDWDWLGRGACFSSNSRPGLSGFLLGPLSVQKRARQMTQRRARQEQIDPTQVVRPNELKDADLDKQETANLTQLCAEIRQTLINHLAESEENASNELSQHDGLTEDEKQEVMEKHGIADNGGIPLFRFCINPRSFGQTVENFFYVSFLIRDGYVGVYEDSNNIPTLHASDPQGPNQAREHGIQKHQAIFSLDFETFEDLIEVYNIRKPVIPPRDEQDAEARKGAVSFWQG